MNAPNSADEFRQDKLNKFCYSPKYKLSKVRKFCKFIRKNVYPEIQFKLHHNAKYKGKDFLDVLTHVAMTHDFTTNGSYTLKLVRNDIPSAKTILYHTRKFEREELELIFQRVFNRIHKIAKSYNLFQGRVDIAIDITTHPYYGDKNDYMVCRTRIIKGTKSVYKFATLNVVVAGKRFTLAAIPVEKYMDKVLIVSKLIKQAEKIVRIRNVYMDRWFFSVDVINLLKGYRLKFLMPARRTAKIKRLIMRADPPKFYTHTLGNQYQGFANVFLYVVNDRDGKKRVFVTNIYVKEENASELFDLYDKRWGIETSYRVKNEFRSKTTSKVYSVRLFYFMFSVCLYNLWVLINVFIGVTFCIDFKKPLITAKIFGTVLYMVVMPVDYG